MRKKHHTKSKPKSTLRVAVFFCAIVFFLIIVSAVFKLISMAQKSKFDGGHRFSMVVDNTHPVVMSFEPETKSISVAAFTNNSGRQISARGVGKFLEIPIEGEVWAGNMGAPGDYQDPPVFLFTLLRSYPLLRTNLTVLDFFRLFMFSRTVPSMNITIKEVPSDGDEVVIDKFSSSLFTDYSLSSEKLSIHIINGTGVSGLGNRLARYITNAGGNVISVSSADDEAASSQIRCVDKSSYTCEYLSKLLRFDIQVPARPGISDIEIVLGTDRAGAFAF